MRVRFPIDTAGPSARALAAIVFHGMGHYDWISFTTDYGLCDCFVASCHGVIARLSPNVRIIDITHDIPPGDVRRGAHVLAEAVEHLPVSVHLAVVDPGVGTDRRAIAVQTPGGILVGPDNGLLPEAADRLGGITDVVELTTTAWFAPRVSPTFHGRDIFAPVAARLARVQILPRRAGKSTQRPWSVSPHQWWSSATTRSAQKSELLIVLGMCNWPFRAMLFRPLVPRYSLDQCP